MLKHHLIKSTDQNEAQRVLRLVGLKKNCARQWLTFFAKQKKLPKRATIFLGGGERNRTDDLLLARQAL